MLRSLQLLLCLDARLRHSAPWNDPLDIALPPSLSNGHAAQSTAQDELGLETFLTFTVRRMQILRMSVSIFYA